MKKFIVVDMQNDFCTGALANPAAIEVIPFIKARLEEARKRGDKIIFTRDTHDSVELYLQTTEGKHLPVPHCEVNTPGWEIVKELSPVSGETIINKTHFGYDKWTDYIKAGDEVTICGTCTDICVISAALTIKQIEGVEVTVLSQGCAGLTKEKHAAALEVMASCQCKIIHDFELEVIDNNYEAAK